MEQLRVFISYSHDSPEHSEWVLKLAMDLRQSGVDAFLDIWDIRPGENFTHWIESAIASADYCVMVCTPRYKDVAEKRESAGVGYEQSIITNALHENPDHASRYIPILRAGGAYDAVPEWLRNRTYLDFREDDGYEECLAQLMRVFFSQQRRLRTLPHPIVTEPDAGTTTIELTISGSLDEIRTTGLLNVLQSYLGKGITITEKKRG